jgi:hypothetical protein
MAQPYPIKYPGGVSLRFLDYCAVDRMGSRVLANTRKRQTIQPIYRSMGVINVKAFANCDMATIAWQTDKLIPNCRGFALQRQVSGASGDAGDDFVRTWVGFKGGTHQPGENEPSTIWPIQRYLWSDYLVSQGQKVRYRVIPMIGPAADLKKASESEWSAWTNWTVIGTGQTTGFEAYFNRGIVPAQFLARQANSSGQFHKMLQADIQNPKSKNRVFLSGPLRTALLTLLEQARRAGVEVYAALYELNDPEIIERLKLIGANCHLVLGSGAYKPKKGAKPAVPDENADVRNDLKKNSKIDVVDRLVKSPHFAHNKFIVFCDKNRDPDKVWTGSLNCTVTGLCTQVNNGILIQSAPIASAYKQRWEELKAAGSGYPPQLAKDGSSPAKDTLNNAPITAWNAPCLKYVDLAGASKYIAAAQQGVLFLMFNPGSGDGKKKALSLLQDIEALDPTKLLIHGVVNQEQQNGKTSVQLTNRGQKLPPVSIDEIVPKVLTDATRNWFHQEFQFNMVMIHSKVVLIDPFGPNPVVITGSHNLGPKASAENDDNMVIIENASGLAGEYAVNIMGVYSHYKWLYNEAIRNKSGTQAATAKKASPQFDGNFDNDQWQNWFQNGAHLREIQFWLGTTPAKAVPSSTQNNPTPAPTVASAISDRSSSSPRRRSTRSKASGKKRRTGPQ